MRPIVVLCGSPLFAYVCFWAFKPRFTNCPCVDPQNAIFTLQKQYFLRGVSNLGVCAFFVKEKTWFHVLACTPPKNNTRVTTTADSANHVSTLVSTSRELGQGWKTHLQGQECKVLPKSGRMRVCDSAKILLDYLHVLVAQNPPKHEYSSSM